MQSNLAKERNVEAGESHFPLSFLISSYPYGFSRHCSIMIADSFPAEAEIASKLATAPETVTTDDARYVKSRESRAQGGGQPAKGSIGAQAESVASANEAGTASQYHPTATVGNATGGLDSATQSQLDREGNYVEAADKIGTKMANDPGQVTQEDASLMHSREVRAHGGAEAGGMAAKAESLASKNDPK